MSADTTPASIGADALREALKWTAAALQAIASDEDTVRDKATGETLSVGQILDAADAALASAAQPVAFDSTHDLVEQCRRALAEELSAWDIDPPLHHVKEAHDACVTWLAAAPKAAPAQCPTSVDAKTMELAESVGLIGPASRTHDLHAAIQRFHDLVCVNATIKAAQMASDAIREAAPAAQGDAEQREVDARHAAIYRWMLSHIADVLNIFDNWSADEEAGTDELHDVLAARAAKEGA